MEQTISHNNYLSLSLGTNYSFSLDAGSERVISSLLQKAGAEMIGTFFIVFVGGIVCVGGASRGDIIGHASAAISGGMIVMIMIFSTAHISRAHLNPAVTLGFAIAGLFPWTQVIPYIFSQIIGSLLASVILQVLLQDATILNLVINQPLHHDTESLMMECVATFLLMFVNFKVACNLGQIGELGGIFIIGITVALLGFIAGSLDRSLSMNPARSIGPILVMMRLKSLHIFVLGPIIGATLSGLIYGMICPRNLHVKKSFSTSSQNYLNDLFFFLGEH